jgi:hypothetical protein
VRCQPLATGSPTRRTFGALCQAGRTLHAQEPRLISDTELRRWLTLLRRPDRLGGTDLAALLRERGTVAANASDVAAGEATVRFLHETIEGMRPAGGATRDQALPHLVLKTCFVDGVKLFQAANKLGMSERQLSRERAWAIGLLRTEIEARLGTPAAPASTYRPEPIPVIGDYLPRPRIIEDLQATVAARRLVVVAGPPGIGKTSLVAELASGAAEQARVLWYRLRPGVNDSLEALLYEIGDLLADEGEPRLKEFVDQSLPSLDTGLAARLAVRGLDGADRLVVLDDYHLVEADAAIGGFVDDAVARLPRLRVVLISRHQDVGVGSAAGFDVPVFSRAETKALLAHLGLDAAKPTVDALHSWTNGVPQLVNLAAAWLKTATPDEVAAGLTEFTSRAQVQAFLLGTITELLDADDRAILDAASIFRAKFSDDAVAAVARVSRGAVLDAALRLVRGHVATRSRGGDTAFFHASVREYVYDRLSPEQRATLHARAAGWFESHRQAEEAEYHDAAAAAARAELAPEPPRRKPRAKPKT